MALMPKCHKTAVCTIVCTQADVHMPRARVHGRPTEQNIIVTASRGEQPLYGGLRSTAAEPQNTSIQLPSRNSKAIEVVDAARAMQGVGSGAKTGAQLRGSKLFLDGSRYREGDYSEHLS